MLQSKHVRTNESRDETVHCELVIIYRKDNTNPNVPKLTEWFLSPQGQQLVRDVGYVPRTQ